LISFLHPLKKSSWWRLPPQYRQQVFFQRVHRRGCQWDPCC
jgi:hypothetical protein